MLTAVQEVLCEWFTFNLSTPSLSPLLLLPNLKSDPERSDIPQHPGYLGSHESLEETAPDCSDSDCSSNSCDGASLELSTNSFSTVPQPSVPEDASLFDWEDTWTQTMEKGNALGLDFTPETVSLKDQAVATSTPQAESLRAPPHHQDARSCGCTYQEHQAFQEYRHLIPPPDSRANETLAGKVPQDICLGADVSDASGPEVSTTTEKPFRSMKRALHTAISRAMQTSRSASRHIPRASQRRPGRLPERPIPRST